MSITNTRAYTNSCSSSQWCNSTISSSVLSFSLPLQSFSASDSFQMSQFFVSGGQSIRVSASTSVPPMNIQGWFPLGWISMQPKGRSRVFSSSTNCKTSILRCSAFFMGCFYRILHALLVGGVSDKKRKPTDGLTSVDLVLCYDISCI